MRQIDYVEVRPAVFRRESFRCVVCQDVLQHLPGRVVGMARKDPDRIWGPVCRECCLGDTHGRWERAHGYISGVSVSPHVWDAFEIDEVLEVVYGRQGAIGARARGEGWSPRTPNWRSLIKNRKARKKIGVPI